MADNIAITAGSGTSVATDDIAGVHYQRVKLAVGADGAAADAPIGGGVEASALRVTLATDSTGVVSVDDNGATLSVDDGAGSLTVDNAGTFAVQVDGAALTALQTIDNLVIVEDAVHASGDSGVLAMGVRRDANTSLVSADGDNAPYQVNALGAVKVAVMSGGTSATDDGAFTAASGAGIPIMGFASADAVDSGDVGVVAMTTSRSLKTVVTNSSGTIIDPQTDDAAFTAATSLVSVVGGFATTDSVDSGDAGAFAMTTARALHATMKTDTAGGPTIFRSLDIDETEEEIKAAAGQVYWIHAVNLTADPIYLKFYNATAANVTVGTTTPVLTFPVVSQGTTDGAGFVFNVPQGIPFGTAITVAATTGVADNDTGAPGANACVINIGYA